MTEARPLAWVLPSQKRVFTDDKEIFLTPREYELIQYLSQRVGQLIETKELVIDMFNLDHHDFSEPFFVQYLLPAETQALYQIISRLRRKLPKGVIENRRGFGYIANHIVVGDNESLFNETHRISNKEAPSEDPDDADGGPVKQTLFAELLAAMLKKKRINQSELASMLDVHRTSVSKWLNNQFKPNSYTLSQFPRAGFSADEMAKLREALGLPLEPDK